MPFISQRNVFCHPASQVCVSLIKLLMAGKFLSAQYYSLSCVCSTRTGRKIFQISNRFLLALKFSLIMKGYDETRLFSSMSRVDQQIHSHTKDFVDFFGNKWQESILIFSSLEKAYFFMQMRRITMAFIQNCGSSKVEISI